MGKKDSSDELIVVDAERYKKIKKALEASKAGKRSEVPAKLDEKENTRELVVVDVKRYKIVKKALADSEERYRQLFENVPIGIYRTTPEGHIVDANPALVKMLGFASYAELTARNLERDSFAPGYERAGFIKRLEREGEIKGLESVWKKKDGTLIYVRENAKLVRGENDLEFFEGTVEDITQGKLAEEAQKVHARQIEILNCIISKGNLAGSLQELLEIILDFGVMPLVFDAAAIFLYDRAENRMNLMAVRGVNEKLNQRAKYMKAEARPFVQVLNGQSVFIDHVPEVMPDMAREWGWRMAGCIPLISKGRVVGALNLISFQREAFSLEEKNILELVGKEAGTLISKLQTETALRESEKFYRTLVDTSPDIIIVLGLDGTLRTVNRSFLQVGGYLYDEVAGHNVLEFVFGVEPEYFREGVRKFAQANAVLQVEYPVRKKDGAAFPLEMSLSLLTDERGQPSGLMGIGRDISERKRAEEAQRIRTQQMEILNSIISSGNLADSMSEMLEKTLESVVEPLGFDTAGIYMYDPEAKKVKLMARRGAPSQFYLLDEYMAITNMPFSQVLLRGQPVFAENLSETLPDLAQKWGWRMACTIPLVSKGRIVGALGVASCQRMLFSVEERNILELIGKEVGTLISKLQTETALRESERYYRTLIDTSPDIIVAMDLEARMITVNQQFLKTGGYFYDEVIGKSTYDFVAGLDRIFLEKRTVNFIKSRKVSGAEYQFKKKNGQAVSLEVSASLLYDEAGTPMGIIAVGRDISERKRAEEQLRFLSSITENTSEAVIVTDADFAITYINKVGEKFFGYTLEELKGKTPEVFNAEPRARQIQKELYKIVATGKSHMGESLNRRKDGSTFYCEYKVMPLVNSVGEIYAYSSVQRDISERKEAEVKLLAYQEQLRALTLELTLVEERERRRIAAELHDQIGQNLALCKLKVAALEKGMSREKVKSELSALRRLLEVSIQGARSLIFDLSPPVLYELGFQAALEWLAEWIGEQYQIPVEFESRGSGEFLEADRQVILFQVVRELLVNVGKHSQASRAKVILSLEERSLNIQVNDDGQGFDASQIYDAKAQKGGFGFFSMRERLNYLGGGIDVKSKPGKGTQIVLTVPQGTPPLAGKREDA